MDIGLRAEHLHCPICRLNDNACLLAGLVRRFQTLLSPLQHLPASIPVFIGGVVKQTVLRHGEQVHQEQGKIGIGLPILCDQRVDDRAHEAAGGLHRFRGDGFLSLTVVTGLRHWPDIEVGCQHFGEVRMAGEELRVGLFQPAELQRDAVDHVVEGIQRNKGIFLLQARAKRFLEVLKSPSPPQTRHHLGIQPPRAVAGHAERKQHQHFGVFLVAE